MSTDSAILTGTLSFDILIRGLLSGGVLFSGTLLGGVRRATPGLIPRMGPLLTAVVPSGATFHWCEDLFPLSLLALRSKNRPVSSPGTLWYLWRL